MSLFPDTAENGLCLVDMANNDLKKQKIFCTTSEAAEILSISVGTVQLWVDTGLLEAWKTPGGHRRITRESINRMLHHKPAAVALATSEQPGGALRALVAEDDADLRLLYQTVLRHWPMGPLVEVVDNGIDALMAIERFRPDLLFIDLDIPGVDGFQMLKILNGKAEHAGMTAVVVTGLSRADIALRGGVPANFLVLPKPISFEKLLSIASALWELKAHRAGRTVA